MVKQIEFEKKGTRYEVTVEDDGKAFIETNGMKAEIAYTAKDMQQGWFYCITDKKFTKKFFGTTKPVKLLHATAQEINVEIQKAKEEWKKNETERARAPYINGEKKIKVDMFNGTYLSAYQVYGPAADLLEHLGLAKYIDGWGYKVEDSTVKELGTEFTYEQAVEYARPAIEKKQQKAEEKAAEMQKKFDTAKKTGKPVEIGRWMDECDDDNEDCSLDIVTKYAMPDGTTETVRNHTF